MRERCDWCGVRAKSDGEVAEAARAWGRMRLLVLAVTEARNSFKCEHEDYDSDDYETGYIGQSVPPCWKTHEWDYTHEPADPGDWCQSCLVRHKWHLALVAIKRIHGGRLRRLQRCGSSPARDAV